MATVTNRLAFLISANADQAIRAFDKTAQSADKQLGKAQKSVDKLGVSMTKFGATGLAVAGTLGSQLYKAGQSANDLSETLNKSAVIFGKNSKAIEDFGKTAADNLGLSQKAAIDAASTFAIFGKAAKLSGNDLTKFSTELVTLSADFASFFNTSPEEAITAIGAALRGESEPIRRYGILLNDATLKEEAMRLGIYKGTGALTSQQKVLAAQAAIMRQSSDAQGDFARTSDGLANQQRILAANIENTKAQIGQAFLPVLNNLTGGINTSFQAFNNVNDATGSLVGRLATFGTVGLGVVSAASLIGGQMIKLRTNLYDADGQLNNIGKTAKRTSVLLGSLMIADLVGTAIMELGGFARETEKRLNTLLTTLGNGDGPKETATAFAELADQLKNSDKSLMGFGALIKQTGKAIRIAGADTDAGRIAIEYLDEAFSQIAAKSPALAQKVIDSLYQQSLALDKTGATYKDNMMLVARYQQQLTGQKNATEAVNKAEIAAAKAEADAAAAKEKVDKATKSYVDTQQKLKDKVVSSANALRTDLGQALDVAKANLKKANEEFNAYKNNISSAITGTIGFGSAQSSVVQNIEALKTATTEVSDAQAEYNKVLSDKDADPDQKAAAYKRLADAQAALTAAQATPKTFIDALKKQENAAVTFAGNIQSLLNLGAKQGLIDQLAASGAEAGNAIASEILSSANPAAYVDQVNGIIANTQSIADRVGTSAAEKFKKAGVDSATALLTGMNDVLSKAQISLKFSNLNKKGKPIKTLKDLTDQLQNSITGLFTVGGFATDDIPQLANGGIVKASPGGTLALLGEGGRNEAVIPLPNKGGIGGSSIVINVNTGVGDPVAIGAAIVDVLQKYQSRTGSLPLKVK